MADGARRSHGWTGRRLGYAGASWAFLAAAALSLPLADVGVAALHPGAERFYQESSRT